MSSEVGSETRKLTAQSSPITLVFHRISPGLTFSSTNYSPRRFAGLLEWLWQSSYWPSISLTFDDGYAELEEILPTLVERFSVRPKVFIPTAYIGQSNSWDYTHFIRRTNHLSRSAITSLSKIGVEFGSHGHSHTDLTGLRISDLKLELRRSKDILEGILNREVTAVSYPFGRCNQAVLEIASQYGYTQGFTMRFPSDDDPSLSHGRIGIYAYDTRLSVARKLGSGFGHDLERIKAGITNRLSGGTVLLNRMRGRG